ncbi:DUF4339 domain-containing protein [Aestuariibacter sp. A3R04]|uniref:DUF4339 domain-containing protein n=1 Tax=Aestuariibacter sp. A3R04 TaxID=2841571 RepID=UPI001C09B29C|nr:DUF4339 domain-containing protein [Aestuariibacter sp. A3R04]MBU3021647.1 DUF4339 domain-containing protein [Aestuariibacter sp. A3R04]
MTGNHQDASISWFYEENGKRKGGVGEADLVALINAGVVSHGTSVWKQGFPDWLKVEDTELNVHLNNATPPPLAGEHVNNTVVWILAFAPILGYFLEWIVAGAANSTEWKAEQAMAEAKYFYITVILNVALSYWDEKRLSQAGHNTKKFKGMTWLVPVYLFQRAKNLNHSMGYFAVWIVSFVLVLSA